MRTYLNSRESFEQHFEVRDEECAALQKRLSFHLISAASINWLLYQTCLLRTLTGRSPGESSGWRAHSPDAYWAKANEHRGPHTVSSALLRKSFHSKSIHYLITQENEIEKRLDIWDRGLLFASNLLVARSGAISSKKSLLLKLARCQFQSNGICGSHTLQK